MIASLMHQFWTGFKAGWRTRNPSFLGILVVSLGIPPLLLLATATYLSQPFSWQLIKDIGLPFWLSVGFSLYVLSNKTLQVFRMHKGEGDVLPALNRQFDIVVFVLLAGLVLSLMI